MLFGTGLAYGALMFAPWVTAASARPLHVNPDGTPAALDHPAGVGLTWLGVENVGFFALLTSWVVWLVVQVSTASSAARCHTRWSPGSSSACTSGWGRWPPGCCRSQGRSVSRLRH